MQQALVSLSLSLSLSLTCFSKFADSLDPEDLRRLAKPNQGQTGIPRIDPFPIIRYYLYHVISADQSSNWTTSGI